ncbi:MAG: hypothetical protein ACOC1X_01825 [Promethearchaeota archaeon]
MGMYDDVRVKCAYCGKKTISQTKLLGFCGLEVFKYGDEIYNEDFNNCVFQLKNKCGNCGEDLRIIIRNGIIKGITTGEPDYIEKLFGNYEKIKQEQKK